MCSYTTLQFIVNGLFTDINVLLGSVATFARCGGFLNNRLTTNLPRNLPVDFFNRLRFDRIVVMSLWRHVFGPPCICDDGVG